MWKTCWNIHGLMGDQRATVANCGRFPSEREPVNILKYLFCELSAERGNWVFWLSGKWLGLGGEFFWWCSERQDLGCAAWKVHGSWPFITFDKYLGKILAKETKNASRERTGSILSTKWHRNCGANDPGRILDLIRKRNVNPSNFSVQENQEATRLANMPAWRRDMVKKKLDIER